MHSLHNPSSTAGCGHLPGLWPCAPDWHSHSSCSAIVPTPIRGRVTFRHYISSSWRKGALRLGDDTDEVLALRCEWSAVTATWSSPKSSPGYSDVASLQRLSKPTASGAYSHRQLGSLALTVGLSLVTILAGGALESPFGAGTVFPPSPLASIAILVIAT